MKANNHKWLRAASTVLACFLLSTCPVVWAESPQYISLQELREQVKEGWHATYEAHGRTIAVDIDVRVPDTDTFPVLRMKEALPKTDVLAAEGQEVHREGNTVLVYMTPKDMESLPNAVALKESKVYHLGEIDWSISAEGNPMTAGEVYALFESELAKYFGPDALGAAAAKSINISSRLYYLDKKTGKVGDEPATEMGSYAFDICNAPRGIHILGDWFMPKLKTQAPGSRMKMSYNAPDDYAVGMNMLEEIDAPAEDVPLRSFAEVKAMYEALIASGNIRSVESLELGYMVYADPKEDGVGWLLPTWFLRAEYYAKADEERPVFDGEEAPMVYTVNADAQHLKPIDPVAATLWTGGFQGESPTLESLVLWEEIAR